MARTLETNGNCRNVFLGTGEAASKLNFEYRVVDDDMAEPPKRKEISSPDFSKTMKTLWQESVSAAKTDEEIS